ncbi:MAG: flagellar biosynthetic protein FliR [Deltaproteobacteria bacterium]|nr:flagellar biosynthetic protein FliR [Deltaproteobacteria bacterium]
MDELVALLVRRVGLEGDPTRWITLTALAAARILPLTVVVPWLGRRTLEPIARTGLVLALAVVLAPIVERSAAPIDANAARLALLLAKETLLGAAIAVAAALPFIAYEQAGRLLDTLRGANVAELHDPLGEPRASPLGALYEQIALVVFVGLGGHVAVVTVLADTFTSFPVTAFPPIADNAAAFVFGGLRLAASAIATAFALAAPAGVALLVTEIALALVARSAPNVPAYFIGLPLKSAVGLALVLLGLTLLGDRIDVVNPLRSLAP